MSEKSKLIEIASLLIQRTEVGTITWNETTDDNKFQTSFEDYSIIVSASPGMIGYNFSLFMLNKTGREIASVATPLPDQASNKLLSVLFGMARRQALKIDQALDEVLNRLKSTKQH
jgi:hypothetical protein